MFCVNETERSKLAMESEVCFDLTSRRVEAGKETNRGTEEERAVASDGFGENLFMSCLKIEPKLRSFQVGLKCPKKLAVISD